jgi:hypothetical protein
MRIVGLVKVSTLATEATQDRSHLRTCGTPSDLKHWVSGIEPKICASAPYTCLYRLRDRSGAEMA